MLSSCCIQIAGLDFRFASPANVFFPELANSTFLAFRRALEAPPAPDRLEIHLRPLAPAPVPARFRHVITTDLQSQIYRAGRTFLIQKFGAGAQTDALRWTTLFDAGQGVADSAGPAKAGSGDGLVLPDLRWYPHYQFLLTGYLAQRRGALHHCAGAVYRGRMYLFPARSGTGKSTLSRLLAASGRFEIAGDDRIVTRRLGRELMAFGTPWFSTAGFSANLAAPLGGIFFLHQSPDNRIEDLSAQNALRRLLPVTDIPWYDEPFSAGILAHCEDLAASVPLRAFHFRPDATAGECLEKALEA